MIKIDFEFTTQYGVFRDALNLPEGQEYTESELSELKLQRLNKWIDIIENPPVPEPEIVEIDGIQYEKIEIDGQTVLKPIGV